MNWNALYSKKRDFHWLETAALDRLLKLANIVPMPKHSLSALDIGCGTGQLVRDLYHRGFNATGIETSSVALKVARSSSVIASGVLFLEHDIAAEPLQNTFDLITCKYVVAFIDDVPNFLSNITASMKSTSTFIVITPDPSSLTEARQHIAPPPLTLERLLRNHFEDITVDLIQSDIYFICKNPIQVRQLPRP